MNPLHTKSKIIFLAGLLALLAGCAARYHALNKWTYTGYSDHEVGPNTFLVSYSNNGLTPSIAKAHLFQEYRCAELTLEKGFTHFCYYTAPIDTEAQNVHERSGENLDIYPRSVIIILSRGEGSEHCISETINAEELMDELRPKMARFLKKSNRGGVTP